MLTAYYDLNLCPPTFELVSFRLRVEQERRRLGEDRVKIVFLPGHRDGFRHDNAWPHTTAGRLHMLEQVAIPICRLLPECEVEMANGPHLAPVPIFGVRAREYGHDRFVSAFAEVGGFLRPQGELIAELPTVTITLREADHWPERNSRVDEWLKVSDLISRMGYAVVMIRDGSKHPMAIEERAAIYRAAVCNLFICNGPAFLSFACDAPTLMFRPTDETLGGVFSSLHWRVCGVEPGQQMPGTPAHQRVIWDDDRADVIMNAFTDFIGMRRQAA